MGARRHYRKRSDTLAHSQEIDKGEVNLNCTHQTVHTRKTSQVIDQQRSKFLGAILFSD